MTSYLLTRSIGQVTLSFSRPHQGNTPLTDKSGSPAGHLYLERRMPPIPLLAQAAAALSPFPLPKVPIRVNRYWTFRQPPQIRRRCRWYRSTLRHRGLRRTSPIAQAEQPVSGGDARPHRDAIMTTSFDRTVRRLRDLLSNEPLTAQKMLWRVADSGVSSGNAKKRQLLTSLIRMYQSPQSHYLNFYGPPGTLTTVPYFQVLQPGSFANRQPSNRFQRQSCLCWTLGALAAGTEGRLLYGSLTTQRV